MSTNLSDRKSWAIFDRKLPLAIAAILMASSFANALASASVVEPYMITATEVDPLEISFAYGFTATDGTSYVDESVTPSGTVGGLSNYKFVDTATDPVTGASASASFTTDFVASGSTIGFINSSLVVTQSNPSGAALQPAVFTLGFIYHYHSNYDADGLTAQGTVTDHSGFGIGGNVGPSSGDFTSVFSGIRSGEGGDFGGFGFLPDGTLTGFDNGKPATDPSNFPEVPDNESSEGGSFSTYQDNTPGSFFSAGLANSIDAQLVFDQADELEAGVVQASVLDPGGTAAVSLTGSSASETPEPASLLTLGLLGAQIARRARSRRPIPSRR